jgi:hypothetical protein
MKKPTILTTKGMGEVDDIYISGLGYLMVRVSFENGTYVTYNLGMHDIEDNILTNEILKTK